MAALYRASLLLAAGLSSVEAQPYYMMTFHNDTNCSAAGKKTMQYVYDFSTVDCAPHPNNSLGSFSGVTNYWITPDTCTGGVIQNKVWTDDKCTTAADPATESYNPCSVLWLSTRYTTSCSATVPTGFTMREWTGYSAWPCSGTPKKNIQGFQDGVCLDMTGIRSFMPTSEKWTFTGDEIKKEYWTDSRDCTGDPFADAKEDCEQCLFGIALSAENDDGMKFKCVAGADLGSAMSAKPMVMMASLTVFMAFFA